MEQSEEPLLGRCLSFRGAADEKHQHCLEVPRAFVFVYANSCCQLPTHPSTAHKAFIWRTRDEPDAGHKLKHLGKVVLYPTSIAGVLTTRLFSIHHAKRKEVYCQKPLLLQYERPETTCIVDIITLLCTACNSVTAFRIKDNKDLHRNLWWQIVCSWCWIWQK